MQPVVETTFSYLGPVFNTSTWPLLEHLPSWGTHHHPGPWIPLLDISDNTTICPPIDLKKEGLPPATERDSIKWWKENRLWSQKEILEFFSYTCKLCGPGWLVCCFLPPFVFQMTGFQCLNMMFPVFFWPPDMIKTSVSIITLWSGSVPAQSYNPQRGIWFSGCGSGSGSELGLAGAGRGWNLFPIVLSQYMFWYMFCCCSVAQSCLTLCDPMDCSTSGFPVLQHLPEIAQNHVHWVGDAIQPSHPLSPRSSPALSLFQHQGLFQRVSSLHQVAKVLELQLQHQSFQWVFRVDFILNHQGNLEWITFAIFSLSPLPPSIMYLRIFYQSILAYFKF